LTRENSVSVNDGIEKMEIAARAAAIIRPIMTALLFIDFPGFDSII